jgi:hypothetical protein
VTGIAAPVRDDGSLDSLFADRSAGAGAIVGGSAFGSGLGPMVPTTISAAINAANPLLTNTRIAIVDESILQIEVQCYAPRQGDGFVLICINCDSRSARVRPKGMAAS